MVKVCNRKHRLVLPYKRNKGTHILRSMEKYKTTPKEVDVSNKRHWKEISFQFNIKGKTIFEHQRDLIYHVNCPISCELSCEDNYISKTACRIHERIKDRNGRDH